MCYFLINFILLKSILAQNLHFLTFYLELKMVKCDFFWVKFDRRMWSNSNFELNILRRILNYVCSSSSELRITVSCYKNVFFLNDLLSASTQFREHWWHQQMFCSPDWLIIVAAFAYLTFVQNILELKRKIIGPLIKEKPDKKW